VFLGATGRFGRPQDRPSRGHRAPPARPRPSGRPL